MRTPIFLVCAFLFGTDLRAQSHALLPQFQGMTGVTWTTPLIADSLPAVDSYEFEVTTAAGHFVEIIGSVDHVFTLSETGLAGDLQREITVRVRTISSGTASSFGAPVSFVTDGAFIHPCGPVSDIEELWHTTPLDVQYREWREQQIQEAIPAVAAYRGGGCATSYRIPVVFHVVHDPSIPLSNIPDAVLLDQLYILNNEFNGPNINTLGENPCIEFCLAPNTPNGEDWSTDFNSTTPGITRWADPVATYHGNGPAAQAQLANVVMFPTDRYLNVWITSTVVDGPHNYVGYGTFPGSSQPLDGVVMEYPYVAGYGGIPEHMEGFILVHEVGHYLGVYHTFHQGSCDAVAPGCVENGDHCCDTPPLIQANTGGCTDVTPNSCGVPEQLENYMDYTYEFCKSTFTENQI
ncbi:MAG: M43 family zinc metalloprotease, partial [Flavobacteriales bacterium]|nr:M43 family zinc metalloprotease [Flavobacteriales bacterium]